MSHLFLEQLTYNEWFLEKDKDLAIQAQFRTTLGAHFTSKAPNGVS